MRKIREILRLRHDLKRSEWEIAHACQMGRSTVGEYLQRAREAGLTWPLPPDLDDLQLEGLLFKRSYEHPARQPQPDWNTVHLERKRKGVTLQLLWQEYRQQHENGMGYTAFTLKYRAWKRQSELSMRQDHHAGEKLFVDYAGMTVPITDRETGEIHQAQVFVATLGASNYTFTEVTLTQNLEDWLGSHRRALEFFGGCPQVIVPDNLKSGVKSPSNYEPELNRTYAEFAEHYGLAVIPARVRKPKDKAKVEVGVQIVERHILAPLRNRTFFSLAEANEAFKPLLEALNNKPFQKLEGNRKSLFETLDAPALRPLPAEAYRLASWRKAKVNIDYHIEIDGHYYSVPYKFARLGVDVRLTSITVEIFSNNQRIAAHARALLVPSRKGRHTTVADHMPKAHQRYSQWSPERLIGWAEKTGAFTGNVVKAILESRPHPEQGFRSCLGLMRLAKTFGEERLEAACKRADHFRTYSYRSVESILKKRLDQEAFLVEDSKPVMQFVHANLRGAAYYQREQSASGQHPNELEGASSC